MLKETSWVRFIVLWHFVGLNKLFFAVLLSLLDDLIETSVLRHEFALEVELKINIHSIVFLNQFVQVQSIDQSFVL